MVTAGIQIRTYCNDEALVKERRDHVVRQAIKVFMRSGYDKTNMRELAKGCQMSIGALYHYFGSKEEILYSIINSATFQQAEFIEGVALKLQDREPVEALVQLVKELYRWHNVNQDTTLFAYQETKNLPIEAQQCIFDSERRILAVLESMLLRGMGSGRFRIDNPKLVAHDILLLGHAWALRRWWARKLIRWEDYAQGEIDLILRMVGCK